MSKKEDINSSSEELNIDCENNESQDNAKNNSMNNSDYQDSSDIEIVDEGHDSNESSNENDNSKENENDNIDNTDGSNNDDDFGIEFIDNEDEPFELEEDDDEEGKEKKKLTKNQVLNRIMAGFGVVILCFTLFWSYVFYGAFHKNSNNEEETTAQQETTTEEPSTELESKYKFFTSKNSDKDISDSVKNTLNCATLTPVTTNMNSLDNQVTKILTATCKSKMTTYDKVRNIYDYMMYYFESSGVSFVNDDEISEACGSIGYQTDYDMEVVYRANNALNDFKGSSQDFAAGYAVMMRALGLDAYYVDGICNIDNQDKNHGYTVVLINNEYYVFDVAREEDESKDTEVTYKYFCKKFSELDGYTEDGIEDVIDSYGKFEVLGTFGLDVMFSDDEYSAFGSVVYKNTSDGITQVNADGDLNVYYGDTVYIAGTVSGSSNNKWKLIERVFDEDGNVTQEKTLYQENVGSSYNEVSYTVGEKGTIKLILEVTDANNRTCAVAYSFEVQTYEQETTYHKVEQESQETTTVQDEDETETTVPETTTSVEKESDETTTIADKKQEAATTSSQDTQEKPDNNKTNQ